MLLLLSFEDRKWTEHDDDDEQVSDLDLVAVAAIEGHVRPLIPPEYATDEGINPEKTTRISNDLLC